MRPIIEITTHVHLRIKIYVFTFNEVVKLDGVLESFLVFNKFMQR